MGSNARFALVASYSARAPWWPRRPELVHRRAAGPSLLPAQAWPRTWSPREHVGLVGIGGYTRAAGREAGRARRDWDDRGPVLVARPAWCRWCGRCWRELMARVVTLYSRAGCHLCEQAEAVLVAVRRQAPFELTVVDVDSDP